jgi:hypothetical protein
MVQEDQEEEHFEEVGRRVWRVLLSVFNQSDKIEWTW